METGPDWGAVRVSIEAGAHPGGLAGSYVPFVGTATGAAVGATAGTFLGIATSTWTNNIVDKA